MSGTNAENLELPNESVKKALEKIIVEKEFVEYSVKITPGSNKGDNYLGLVYKVEVTGSNKNGCTTTLNVFVKLPVPGESIRMDFFLRDSFLREIYLYDVVLKEIKKYEDEKHIKDGFTSYSKCFATGTKDLEEFLILEDLSKVNFVMFDRMKKLDLTHTQLVMKALGKLHAHSFAMRFRNPELFGKLTKNLQELLFRDDMSEAMKNLINTYIEKAKGVEVDGIYKKKWEDFLVNFNQHFKDCCNSAGPFAVINHGDCWNNNMLYRYENGVPVEVRLVDWQISRFASPVLDLTYYIFSCTEKSLRDQHYQSLVKIYHESLTNFLTELGCSAEKLFSYSELQYQLHKFGKFGLIMAVLLIPHLLASAEDTRPLEEMFEQSDYLFDNKNLMDSVHSRYTDVITDMVDLDYI